MQLSNRLLAVAGMVTEGNTVADVGCDHGYIPIYLIQQKKIPCAIAMDIRRGPLSRAEAHIEENGLREYIQTRLSDGVQALKPGEADTLIIAGMGGGLVRKILRDGEEVLRSVSEFILQPQSEIRQVRFFLQKNGYFITDETMVLEDGKYYPMMRAVHGEMEYTEEIYLRYGRELLQSGHPVLRQFLEKERDTCLQILDTLSLSGTSQAREREKEIQQEMQYIKAALQHYEM